MNGDVNNTEAYLAQFEAWLVEALASADQDEVVTSVVAVVGQLAERVAQAELRLALARAAATGRRTERLSSEQLSLMLEQVQESASDDDDAIDALDAQLSASEERAEQERKAAARNKPRRSPLPAHLPRQEHHHTLGDDDCTCPTCQRRLAWLGDDVSETLAIIPARFVVKRHRVAKYACGYCKDGVTTGPRPPKPVPGGLADASLLAHIVCAKYLDHIPLQRLRTRYGRDGVDLPISTLADQVGAVARLVMPLVDVIEARMKGAHVVQTDASGLKVLDREDPDGIRRGTMWCYVGDRRWVRFQYAPTGKGADGPWPMLEHRRGYVQADADNTFDRLFNGRVADALEVGCWAHARRRLFQLKDADHRVAYPLKLIAMLYRIEREATRDGLTPLARARRRVEQSTLILRRLFAWYVRTAAREPPTSALGRACRYALNHRVALERFVEDGHLRLDNNFCELQIRSLAVGRKNYLFAGSDEGAERAAALYSLLRTAVLHGVDPQAYLTDVLDRLADRDDPCDVEALLPDVWAPQHEQHELIDEAA